MKCRVSVEVKCSTGDYRPIWADEDETNFYTALIIARAIGKSWQSAGFAGVRSVITCDQMPEAEAVEGLDCEWVRAGQARVIVHESLASNT